MLGDVRISAHRAGVSVRAFTPEIRMATARVRANCRKKIPTGPDMNVTGTNTADMTSVMAITAPPISLMAALAASQGQIILLHLGVNGFDDHNRIIDHDPDGQYQRKERDQVDGKAEQLHEKERTHQRHRHGQGRNERGAPVLQKQEHHQGHQYKRFDQRMDHLVNRRVQKARYIVAHLVVIPAGNELCFSSAIRVLMSAMTWLALEPGSCLSMMAADGRPSNLETTS